MYPQELTKPMIEELTKNGFSELKTSITDRDNINLKLDAILDSITTTDMALLNKEISKMLNFYKSDYSC